MPLPDWIRNKPELLPGLDWYWITFWKLNTCRQVGFGEGCISHLDVLRYAELIGLNSDQTGDLEFIIRAMDTKYLEIRAPKKDKG